MTLVASIDDTPFGPMTILSADDVVHVAVFGTDVDAMRHRLPAGLRTEPVHRDDSVGSAALRAYFDGDIGALDQVRVQQPGSAYHVAAWREMRTIAAGTTVSYAELAARAGSPRAVRAAGSACARNAVCLFVPCHRVVRSDGSLGGYYYGPDVKRRLIEHEAGHRPGTAAARSAPSG